jgi:Icc-related predicted phosphoesterase
MHDQRHWREKSASRVRILTISDEVMRQVYGSGARERFHDVQLILSCGDLPEYYLEFAVSTLNVPCLYVPGNHDGKPMLTASGKTGVKHLGCDSVDGRVRRVAGLTIAGLGGSPWYNGEMYQYTEGQMRRRVLLLALRLVIWRRRTGLPLDIMMTHAAPRGIHDGPGPHRGFLAFRWLIEHFHPRYFIHGHVHPRYGYNRVLESVVDGTTVINTVGFRVLDVVPTISKRRRYG